MIRNWEWVKQIVCKTVARNIGAIRVHFTPYFTHLSDQIGVLPVPRMGNEMEVISITLILKSKNGRITGKTDEVNAIIEKDIINFMKTKGCAYIELTKHYSGTPAFESPVFTLNGGKFQATYAAV